MRDKYGRRINYLRISVTDLCNLRCKYCMPIYGIYKGKHVNILRNEEIEEIVKAAAKLGINKVRITGGEPLIRKGIVDIVNRINNIHGIRDISMTTNGMLLKEYAKELKERGLKRVNISIDTLDKNKYYHITRGGDLNKVLLGIEEAKQVGLMPIKLNVVLIGGFNDNEIGDFLKITLNEEIDVRFIELMPFGEASTWSKEHFVSNKIILNLFPDLVPQEDEEAGSPARYYKLPNSKGRIGLINPISDHFCSSCNRLRITSEGRIKPCLHSDMEIDIRKELENKSLEEILMLAIGAKPESHKINDEEYVPVERSMYQIGG